MDQGIGKKVKNTIMLHFISIAVLWSGKLCMISEKTSAFSSKDGTKLTSSILYQMN